MALDAREGGLGGGDEDGRHQALSSTEFLIEVDSAATLPLLSDAAFPNAWTLVRSDHSLLLDGASWPHQLAQLCSFDFTRLQDEPDLVVMTLLAGISVTLIREPTTSTTHSTSMALRLWCDASFSVYLQQCLHSIRGPR